MIVAVWSSSLAFWRIIANTVSIYLTNHWIFGAILILWVKGSVSGERPVDGRPAGRKPVGEEVTADGKLAGK